MIVIPKKPGLITTFYLENSTYIMINFSKMKEISEKYYLTIN
jgi:hypothetical protein